jgi:hypothetical protein
MCGKLFFLEANSTNLNPLVTYEPTTSVLNPSDTVTMSAPTTSTPVTAEPSMFYK